MDDNLRDFMSKDEQKQMDDLIQRAVERKERRKEAAVGSQRFQFFMCQCENMEEMKDKGEVNRKGTAEQEQFDIQQLLAEICSFCRKYGMCQSNCQKKCRQKNECADAADEELPF